MTRRPRPRAPDPKAPIPTEQPTYLFWVEERRALAALLNEALPHWRWLMAVLAVAALLRFADLSNSSLWMDEVTIIEEAYAGKYKVVSYIGHWTHLLPVSIILQTLGQTVFALRLWGALLGTLACPILAVAGILAAGARVGVAAGFLAAFNCFLVMYSQDGNYYGGMTFYTSIQLLAYICFFRGAPHASILATLVVGAISYRNHPLSVVPTAVMMGGMFVGACLYRSVRQGLVSLRPADWRGLPLVPLVFLLAILGSPFYSSRIPKLIGFLTSMINPGEGSLTNVELSASLLWRHVTVFLMNFFRPGRLDLYMALIPALVLAGGLIAGAARGRRMPHLMALTGLAILVPVVSYFLLFSFEINRNFNIRYFIYVLPILLLPVSLGGVLLGERLAKGRVQFLPVILLLTLCGTFTMRYLLTDTSNYRAGAQHLREEFQPGDRLLLTTRNDRVEARYHLRAEQLPTLPPLASYLYQPAYSNLLASSFPAMMAGNRGDWIVSAWRYVEMPGLYALLDQGLKESYCGTSKWGREHDFKLYRWDVADRVLFPNIAARFSIPSDGEDYPTLVAGPGKWLRTLEGDPDSTESFGASGPIRINGRKDKPGVYTFVPVLDPVVPIGFDRIVNPPVHSRYFLGEHAGTAYLRSERDSHHDFLVYQDEAPRRLVVRLLQRDETDPILAKNSQTIPSGMMVGIAVDGMHRGFWPVSSGPRELVEISADLDLPQGNHRISIWGLQPRLVYTAFFPWDFVGAEWTTDISAPTAPSLEESGKLQVSPGWASPPVAGAPGGAIGREWVASVPGGGHIDSDVRAPAGDPAIRIEIPGEGKHSLALLSPPMPVKPETLAVAFYYLKYNGLEHVELSPIVAFADSQGRPVGGNTPVNGPNHRGTTLEAWVRVSVAVPVPPGAAFLRLGFMGYPYNGESTGATIHVGSFHSPGCESIGIDDPLL